MNTYFAKSVSDLQILAIFEDFSIVAI